MTPEEIALNAHYFPNYLVFRRQAEHESGDKEEWQGFVKDIKISLKKSQQDIKKQIESQQFKLAKRFESQIQALSNFIANVSKRNES